MCSIHWTFKITPSPVPRGSHRKMNPDDAALLFYQQLVEVLAAHIADVQQDGRIAQSLFHPDATDVHGAPRQVVRRKHTTHRLVHLWTSEPRVDDNRVVTIAVLVVPSLPQTLQPSAHPTKVLHLCLIRHVCYSRICLGSFKITICDDKTLFWSYSLTTYSLLTFSVFFSFFL